MYTAIYWVATLTALLTAFYTGRAFFKTFFGPEKLPSPDDPEADEALDPHAPPASAHANVTGVPVDVPAPESAEIGRYEASMDVDRPHPAPEHAPHDDHGHGGHDAHFGHESGWIMIVPLLVLAAGAVLVGMVFGPITEWFAHLVEETPGFEELGHGEHAFDYATAITGTIAALLGIGLSALMYLRPSDLPARISAAVRPLAVASQRKFYVDEIYNAAIVAPTRVFAFISRYFDTFIIEGLVKLVATAPRLVGRDALGPIQNGLIQSYAAVTALGIALLLVVLLFLG